MNSRPSLHAVTWLLWAVAAVLTIQVAPNPFYVALVIAVAAVVVEAHGRPTAIRRAFPTLVALGVIFGVLRVFLTAVTTEATGPVAFTLPEFTLPRLLGGITFGGAVGWTVVLRAAADAFVVIGLMAAFGAFNAVAALDELLQRAPRAFHEPGLVVAVALSFVPSTIASARDAREADRARTGGRAVRRGRVLRLVMPILETGLERAAHLADSMDARGFGHLAPSRGDAVAAWFGLGSLLALGGGFVALVGRADGLATVLAAIGVGALLVAVLLASRARGHTVHRPRPLQPIDIAVVAVAVAVPVLLVLLGWIGDDTLTWTVGPLHVPGFSPAAAAVVALLAAPVLVRGPQ